MSEIKVEIQGSTATVTPIVALWSELNTVKLQEAIDELLANREITKIILDLHTVSYLTSNALGILVNAQGSVQNTPRSLILCRVQRSVKSIFEATKLNIILDIRPTLADAHDENYRSSGVDQERRSFKSEQQGDSMVIHVVGNLMGGPDGEKFVEDCKEHLKNPKIQRLVLDLQGTQFISNNGLGTLIVIYIAAKECHKGCIVYKVPRRVRQIFVITKVNTILEEIETI